MNKLIQCIAGNPTVHLTSLHSKKKKEKTRLYIKKDFSCKQGKVALIGTQYNRGEGM